MSHDDPFIEGLLSAARQDVAPNESARFDRLFDRTREAIGSGDGGGGGGGKSAPGAAASPTSSGWFRIVKGAAVVCAGLAVVGVCTMQVRDSPAPASPSAITTPTATIAPSPPSLPTVAAPASLAPSPPAAGPAAALATASAPGPASPAPVATAKARPSAEAAEDDIAAQIALVEAARGHMREGNLRSTLGALDEHDRRFARSRVRDEATVLRIEALSKLGRHDEARALGRRFLDGNPQSLYRRRVSQLLGGDL